ncbi:uncharacterized protein LOC128886554 isoform X1 [Hylaeus anthracinus]|uniref:uncharacterized protein LOC128886554 isoform X1 n=2 Tax=Hylaeus anthracinus TaxID=313031 RepID=UPI0023B8FEFD|nr:uncharacterized protein LOC128886554 isoform X1 [Hylaeus anthracinus]
MIHIFRYPGNVDDLMQRYEDFLVSPLQTTKKSVNSFASKSFPCSHARTNAYRHAKKRQSSSHRYQQGNKDQGFSAIREGFTNSTINDNVDGCRGYDHIAKNEYRKDGLWTNYQMLAGASGNSDVDSNVPLRSDYYNRKGRTRNPQSRISRQPVENSNRLTTNGKNDSDNDNIDLEQEFFQLNLSKNVDLGNIDQEREAQAKGKPNALSSKLSTVRSCMTKVTDSQTLSKSKNTEDPTKHKALPVHSDEDCRKEETENISFCKPSKRSIARRSSVCRPDDESVTGRECIREDTAYEMIVKDDDQETGKNVFAGGDLDLHATKNHILGVIDRAICKEFGNTSDQQKDADSNRELTSREVYIEVTRALQGDCCLWRLGDRDSKDKYIGMLKLIRSDHLNHIQDEVKKLCNLQKFLDACSPRLSSSMSQSHSGIVERPEERQQQQHDDKHSLGTTL